MFADVKKKIRFYILAGSDLALTKRTRLRKTEALNDQLARYYVSTTLITHSQYFYRTQTKFRGPFDTLNELSFAIACTAVVPQKTDYHDNFFIQLLF